MRYLVVFRNGSSDYVDAPSSWAARQFAEKSFGGKVSRVEVVKDCIRANDDGFDEDEEFDDEEGETEE